MTRLYFSKDFDLRDSKQNTVLFFESMYVSMFLVSRNSWNLLLVVFSMCHILQPRFFYKDASRFKVKSLIGYTVKLGDKGTNWC